MGQFEGIDALRHDAYFTTTDSGDSAKSTGHGADDSHKLAEYTVIKQSCQSCAFNGVKSNSNQKIFKSNTPQPAARCR